MGSDYGDDDDDDDDDDVGTSGYDANFHPPPNGVRWAKSRSLP